MNEPAQAVRAGMRDALYTSQADVQARIDRDTRARWLRDFERAASHYLTTGQRYAYESPHGKLLRAIFGE